MHVLAWQHSTRALRARGGREGVVPEQRLCGSRACTWGRSPRSSWITGQVITGQIDRLGVLYRRRARLAPASRCSSSTSRVSAARGAGQGADGGSSPRRHADAVDFGRILDVFTRRPPRVAAILDVLRRLQDHGAHCAAPSPSWRHSSRPPSAHAEAPSEPSERRWCTTSAAERRARRGTTDRVVRGGDQLSAWPPPIAPGADLRAAVADAAALPRLRDAARGRDELDQPHGAVPLATPARRPALEGFPLARALAARWTSLPGLPA